MSRVLIVGDSQAAGPAGRAAEQALRAAGRDVLRLAQVGRGPVSWARDELWRQYVDALSAHRPADVVLIFGSNDYGPRLAPALDQLRGWAEERFNARVWYSGPPHYLDPERERIGASIRNEASGAFGDQYIDAWPLTPTSAGRAADGVHLTEAAGRPWGEAIASAVLATRAPVELAHSERPRATLKASTWPWVAGAALVGLGLVALFSDGARGRRPAPRSRSRPRRASSRRR